MACNNNCNQGRDCTCYACNFDQLGNKRETRHPWRIADLIVLAILFVYVALIVAGVAA